MSKAILRVNNLRDKITFEQRTKENEGINHVNI